MLPGHPTEIRHLQLEDAYNKQLQLHKWQNIHRFKKKSRINNFHPKFKSYGVKWIDCHSPVEYSTIHELVMRMGKTVW